MKNCVFCEMIENPQLEEYRTVFSNKKYVCILVSNPETKGHVVLFPKTHFSELSQMKDSSELFKLAIKLAEDVTKRLNAKAYVLKVNNKVFMLDDNPLHVGHIHVHVIPRYSKNDSNNIMPPIAATKESLRKIKSDLLF